MIFTFKKYSQNIAQGFVSKKYGYQTDTFIWYVRVFDVVCIDCIMNTLSSSLGTLTLLATVAGPLRIGLCIPRTTKNTCLSMSTTRQWDMESGRENVHFGKPTYPNS